MYNRSETTAVLFLTVNVVNFCVHNCGCNFTSFQSKRKRTKSGEVNTPTLTLLYCLTDMFWLVAVTRDLDIGYSTRVFLHFLYVDMCRMLSILILDIKDPDHPMPNTRIHLRGETPSGHVLLML